MKNSLHELVQRTRGRGIGDANVEGQFVALGAANDARYEVERKVA